MAEFGPAYAWMIPHEVIGYGKPDAVWYTDDPRDHGGKTAWGITEAFARDHGYVGRMDMMTEDQARALYFYHIWKFEGIASQQVASKLFDAAVNFGLSRAVKQAQRAVGFPEAEWDGRLGPKTLEAINALAPADFLTAFCEQLLNRYAAIVQRDPTQAKYIRGWSKRALQLPPED